MNNVIRFPVERARKAEPAPPGDCHSGSESDAGADDSARSDYYDLALEHLLLVLAGKSASPHCQQLQAEMRRQWPHVASMEAVQANHPWR
ncbi:MAG: hypothetical protein CVV17_03535 [Gammaproteobacteria bacterium HGW-Gammaproteobacteria-7]|nr:MAG: hypothetical protein CVV17_03535 [Gammaproteobacteria bacterium HGW-Gammaproteobacteria-7]